MQNDKVKNFVIGCFAYILVHGIVPHQFEQFTVSNRTINNHNTKKREDLRKANIRLKNKKKIPKAVVKSGAFFTEVLEARILQVAKLSHYSDFSDLLDFSDI